MAFTFQGTKISDITVVEANGTSTNLTEFYQGPTKVWGKRNFTVTLVNPDYMNVSYSYKDAGGYTKSGTLTSTTTFSNVGYTENITITASAKDATTEWIYSVDTTGGTFGPNDAKSLTITASRVTAEVRMSVLVTYYAITSINSKASTSTTWYTDTITGAYGSTYSKTYTKPGYISQTVTGTLDGAHSDIVTLQPQQYQLSFPASNKWDSATNWFENDIEQGNEITWRYYGYSANFYAMVPAHYKFTGGEDSEVFYNGDIYSETVDANSTENVIATVTVPQEIVYTYQMTASNSTYCYYGSTQPTTGNTSPVTSTYANRTSTHVSYLINPITYFGQCVHYGSGNDYYWYYNGNPIKSSEVGRLGGSAFTFIDNTETATYNYTDIEPIVYSWSVNSANSDYCYYSRSSGTPTGRPTITANYDSIRQGLKCKINPSEHYCIDSYTHDNPYTQDIDVDLFTFSDGLYDDSTQTCPATYTKNCTAIEYTLQVKTRSTIQNIAYCYYGATAPTTGNTDPVIATAANISSKTVYYKIAPENHYFAYYGTSPGTADRFINSYPIEASVNGANFTLDDSTKTATYIDQVGTFAIVYQPTCSVTGATVHFTSRFTYNDVEDDWPYIYLKPIMYTSESYRIINYVDYNSELGYRVTENGIPTTDANFIFDDTPAVENFIGSATYIGSLSQYIEGCPYIGVGEGIWTGDISVTNPEGAYNRYAFNTGDSVAFTLTPNPKTGFSRSFIETTSTASWGDDTLNRTCVPIYFEDRTDIGGYTTINYSSVLNHNILHYITPEISGYATAKITKGSGISEIRYAYSTSTATSNYLVATTDIEKNIRGGIRYGGQFCWYAVPKTGYTLNSEVPSSSNPSKNSNFKTDINITPTASPNAYILTISKTNPSYGTYAVKNQSGVTLADGSTIYYDNVLTGTARANSPGAWSFTSLTAPTAYAYDKTGEKCKVSIYNSSGQTCDVYRGTTLIKSGLASGSYYNDTTLDYETEYTYYLKANASRYVYSVVSSDSTKTVTGNTTMSAEFARNTETQLITSPACTITTPERTTFTVSYNLVYDDEVIVNIAAYDHYFGDTGLLSEAQLLADDPYDLCVDAIYSNISSYTYANGITLTDSVRVENDIEVSITYNQRAVKQYQMKFNVDYPDAVRNETKLLDYGTYTSLPELYPDPIRRYGYNYSGADYELVDEFTLDEDFMSRFGGIEEFQNYEFYIHYEQGEPAPCDINVIAPNTTVHINDVQTTSASLVYGDGYTITILSNAGYYISNYTGVPDGANVSESTTTIGGDDEITEITISGEITDSINISVTQQQYYTLTINVSNATVTIDGTSTKTAFYKSGDSFSSVITLNSGYCMYAPVVPSGITYTATSTDTINNVSMSLAGTITGTITSNTTLTLTTKPYYTFTYGGTNNRFYGSFTFENSKTKTINSAGTGAGIVSSATSFKYTGTMTATAYYYAQAVYTASSQTINGKTYYGYGQDDRIISAYAYTKNGTSITPSTETLKCSKSTTYYNKVYINNASLSGGNYIFNVTMVDSKRTIVNAPSACSVVATYGSYTYTIPASGSEIFFTPYSGGDSSVTLASGSTSYTISPTTALYKDSSATGDTVTVTATAKTGSPFSITTYGLSAPILRDSDEDYDWTVCDIRLTVNQAYYVKVECTSGSTTKYCTISVPYKATSSSTTTRSYSITSYNGLRFEHGEIFYIGTSSTEYAHYKLRIAMNDNGATTYNPYGDTYTITVSTRSDFDASLGYVQTMTGTVYD